MGVPVIESYGMSEAGLLTVNLPPKRGSVGISVIDSLAVIDDNGNKQNPYEKGEIIIKGGLVFSGYENAPDENRNAFNNGWFKTGDIGYLDDEGYLYLTGRKTELINKGGEKISPAEIDNALMTHPSVRSAMAFRVSDPVLGEDIAAMVVAEDPDASEEDLRRYLLDRLISFKVPKRIYFVDELPKGSTGKLLRSVGTDRYRSGLSEKAPTQGQTNEIVSPESAVYQNKLLQIWNDTLDVSSLSPDDDFFRCGGNSLAAIELLIKIQRAFQLTIPPDTIYRYPTIRQQARMIAQKTGTEHLHPLIVPIRTDGVSPPLFCFHSIGGWIGPYQNIFRSFNQDRPVFGIRARGLEPGEKPWLTIEEAVREYIDAIKTVQKEGPYYLLGYSAGAIYAFELACQLQSRGESVAYLGNIDQSVPVPHSRESGKGTYLLSGGKGSSAIMAAGLNLFDILHSHLKTKPDSTGYSLFVTVTGTIYKSILWSGFRLHPSFGSNHESAGEGEKDWTSTYPEKQRPLLKIHRTALRQYKPRTFLGNLTLFSTGPDWGSYPGDRTRGWSAFTTGNTILIDIPGMHSALFQEPFADLVAQKIEESLTRVDPDV
jgi:thioesterase domain-containing protein/acyl carrier protein